MKASENNLVFHLICLSPKPSIRDLPDLRFINGNKHPLHESVALEYFDRERKSFPYFDVTRLRDGFIDLFEVREAYLDISERSQKYHTMYLLAVYAVRYLSYEEINSEFSKIASRTSSLSSISYIPVNYSVLDFNQALIKELQSQRDWMAEPDDVIEAIIHGMAELLSVARGER